MDKYEKMLEKAMAEHIYSPLEKDLMHGMLDSIHAKRVKETQKGIYEVFYMCDAIPDKELNTILCDKNCQRYYNCSNCAMADDLECIINQEKTILDLEPSDTFYFEDEIRSIINNYRGDKNTAMSKTETNMLAEEIVKELKCLLK